MRHETFLAQGTSVTAVGFGQSDPAIGFDSGGVKRTATSTLPLAVGVGEGTFFVNVDWVPDAPWSGDSGGPLMAQLPDGTWRVIGIASTWFVEYATPWPHVGWMLSDPSVVQSEIIPCHTPQGEWGPSPGCGGFPLSPGSPSGSWGRGPMACLHGDVGGPSQTCGPPGVGDSGAVDETGAAPPPTGGVLGQEAGPSQEQSPASGSSGCACRVGSTGSRGSAIGVIVAFAVGVSRRRRRRPRARKAAKCAASSLMALMLLGCPKDPGNSGGGSTGDGGPGLPPGPPPIDPNNVDYQGILGGIDPDPTIDYHDLAVANVSRATSSTACCQDYVIASPSTPNVRVLFSADLPGLPFLADLPDELVNVGGPGVDDVLLADVDADDRNDLVALRTDGSVAVVRGIAGPPGGPFFDPVSLAVYPTGAGAGAMVAADLDCDGDLDFAVTAPAANAFVRLVGAGNGTFAASAPTLAGSAPQDIAVGDVDGDGDPDVAVSNDNGSFSIALNGCGSFAPPSSYAIYPTTTPQMPIAMGKLCPGHPNDMAVAVGIFDIVYLTCGDGSGSFADVVEPHGVQVTSPLDYFWDPSEGNVTEKRITDLFVWETGPTLYTLRSRIINPSELAWLPPNPSGMDSSSGRVVARLLGGAPFSEFVVHTLQANETPWSRVAFIGSPGLGVTK